MKNTLRIFITAVLFLVVCGYGVYAADWDCTATPEGVSTAEALGDNITLSFASAGSSRSASAEKEFDFSQNAQIVLAFDAEFTGTKTAVNRRIYIRNSSVKAVELFNFTGTSLEILGSSVAEDLEENRSYNIAAAIYPAEKRLAVWLDSVLIYDGDMGTKWKDLDLTQAKIYIRNNTTSSDESITSDFKVSNFLTGDAVSSLLTTPADGEKYVSIEGLQNIAVRFDSPVSNESVDVSNFILKKDGEEVGISVSGDLNTVYITPDDGFSGNALYELTVLSVKDLFGQTAFENQVITFTTALEGYAPPEVTISSASTEIYDMQSCEITVNASSEAGIEKIELYKNGTLCDESNANSLVYNFSGEAGTYTFYAYVYDINQSRTESQHITITVLHNEKPTVSISGITAGEVYKPYQLDSVAISATDSDGSVDRIEVYVGSKLFDTIEGGEGTVDLSGLTYGRYLLEARAYDNLGEASYQQISLVVSGDDKTRVYFSSDFNAYVSDGEEDPGITFYRNGDCKIKSSNDFGEEHGTVVVLSSEGETIDGATADGSWGRFNSTGTKSAFRIDMDIYLGNESSAPFFILKHPSQSIAISQVEFKNGTLSLNNQTGQSVTIPVEPERWYSISYEVDMVKHIYSFWLDGELVAENFGTLPTLTEIDARFVFGFEGNVPAPTFVAFDNLTITYIEPVAQIVSVGYDDVKESAKINPDAKTLVFTLNQALAPASINNNSVILTSDDGQMVYESVKYDDASKQITITVSEPLKSNSSYRLELTSKVTDSSGTPLTNGASAYFETGYADFDVYNAEFEQTPGSIRGRGKIINNTGEDSSCVVILVVFDGTKQVDTCAVEVTAKAGNTADFVTDEVVFGQGNTAELYFWKTVSGQETITQSSFIK